ncbi:unnamed protein product [Linum tenue]|uniref:Uncharacterized protein n=1 Tax=Linum tenue TaxID=586396 RepID=A0AAV0ICZ2_9ROSI|nr:unnamed protein product [Linum tenue]
MAHIWAGSLDHKLMSPYQNSPKSASFRLPWLCFDSFDVAMKHLIYGTVISLSFSGSFQPEKIGDNEQEPYSADGVPRYLHQHIDDIESTFIGLWNGDEQKSWESKHEVGIHELLDLRKYAIVTGDGRSLRKA